MTCDFIIQLVLCKIGRYVYLFSAAHIMLLPCQKNFSSYSLLSFVYVTSQLRHSLCNTFCSPLPLKEFWGQHFSFDTVTPRGNEKQRLCKIWEQTRCFMRDMQIWNQAFSQDVTSAILVLQTMKRLQGSCVEHFSYVITFFCTNKLA